MVPFWVRLRRVKWFKSGLNGVNAAAIGLVGAACVILYEGAASTTADAMVFVLALTLTMVYGIAAPLVVLAGSRFQHNVRPGQIVCPNSDSVCPNSEKIYLMRVTFKFLFSFHARRDSSLPSGSWIFPPSR
jgi:hypothetical protein